MRPGLPSGAFALALAAGSACTASAHETSESVLQLRAHGTTLDVRVDVPLRDLHHALDLDRDRDGVITWRELRARQPEIARLVDDGVQVLARERACPPGRLEHLVAERGGARYAVARFSARCGVTRPDAVAFTLLGDVDPSHRAYAHVDTGARVTTAVLGPGRTRIALDAPPESWTRVAVDFFREGTHHALAGPDHLLFVATLLLPIVLIGPSGRSPGRDARRQGLLEVLAVVTAFTVAHGLTLGAVTLWSLSLPARPVESAIAATVVVAALANLMSSPPRPRWAFAFVLGLVHGLGLGGALVELGLPGRDLVLALAAFNAGIEAGQLAVVVALVPALHALRALAPEPARLMRTASALVACIGAAWLVERGFELGAWLA